MKNFRSYSLLTLGVLSLFTLVWANSPGKLHAEFPKLVAPLDTPTTNAPGNVNLPYPFKDRYADPYSSQNPESPLYLNTPSNIKTTIEYDPDERQYDINEKMGNQFFRSPSYMTFEEFKESQFKNSTKDYWKKKANEESLTQRKSGFSPRLYVGGEAFNRIFGGNTIDIRPQGSASLSFGLNVSKYDNPTLPERQRKNTTFDFKEKIQMNVIGNIGEKLKITTNYNTEASFDFENQIKLEYTGYEDEIIQKIEAGNVALPLNSQLIQGSQSLFGLKTQLKFGRLTVTSILSQQKGKASNIEVKGGATTTKFDISADQYEANKHYFIGNYFKDNYDKALKDLPFINSTVNITRIEVWVTNKNNSTDNTRTILGLMDLGESNFYNVSDPGLINSAAPFNDPYPSDSANSLYANLLTNYPSLRDVGSVQNTMSSVPSLSSSRDYEVVQNARKLNPNEYTFNARLGYVSLNQSLNSNEVLGVAYEYTVGNKVYRVGELTTSGVEPPKVLVMKLLKARVTNTKLPTWDLMMKNIYALGGFQIDKKDFKLDVLYYVDTIGNRINYLPVGTNEPNVYARPLNRFFSLDKLNSNNDPRPDGEYDFIEGVTINSNSGRIIFPVREPFSGYLRSQFASQTNADVYAYDVLYDSTKTVALQQPEKNKFSLKGSYSSKFGSDIPLNQMNIPEGSVKVTAGGIPLTENVDYTVDYNLGRVKIINQSILNSGTAINISLESNSLFSIQSKTLFGSRFDYVVNKDFVLGGTIMRLNERPITQKVNFGDEPIANTMWGVDGTWKKESRWLTKMIDKLPGISTKAPSNITVSGEFANLIPGNSKAIGKNGTAYIDDFEGSQTTIDLKSNVGAWTLASTPQSRFGEAKIDSITRAYGFNRAKFSWYIIDPLFYRNQSGVTPSHITSNDISNNLVRQIPEKEIFPNKEAPQGQTVILPVMNMSFYPEERGPYNYDVLPTPYSAGVAADGKLNNPASRWGGVMRRIESTDFDAANIEFIQFWMMDPFNSNSQNVNGGELYFDLGNISEDILKDGKLEYENGLPATGDTSQANKTVWGFTPKTQPPIIYAFDNNPDARQYQDVGLDGVRNGLEQAVFQDYLSQLSSQVSPVAYQSAVTDPSSDNYHYYRGTDFDNSQKSILDRYKEYSNPDGNSPTENQSTESYSTSATTIPDVEDVNKDFNQEASEQFYEYHVPIHQGDLDVGRNFIVDKITRNVALPNGSTTTVTWYQFKIPIRDIQTNPNITKYGDIEGFNTISFIRTFMTGFSEPMTLRFAKLEFLRGEWRKYAYDLHTAGEIIPGDPNSGTFDIAAVSIEENGNRTPVPYVIPPGIEQETNIGSTTLQRLNEQSLSLKVCDLEDGDARAAFKNLDLDLRSYKKVKMFIHAESSGVADDLKDNDLSVFVRVGNDFTENYYEYEVPLKITKWGSTDAYSIWPESNNLELDLDKFVNLKLARNTAIENSGGSVNITNLYSTTDEDGKNHIAIKGNPSLSSVRTIMIGIRNPKRDPLNPGSDDGATKCGEIWVNELRLTDFDKKGGWAATGRVTTKLADVGNVAVTGTHKSIGFGSIEQKVSERRRSDETSFNVTSSLYLGKFLPEKAALDIPMYVNYGTVVSNPQYDPLDQDVPFDDALANAQTKADKKELKKRSQDYTRNKSINFTNVKKNRVGNAKAHIYDVENFNFTYGYDEIFHRDINIEYDVTKTHKGALGYNFNTTPKYFAPLAKSAGMKSKYLKLIKDVNINLIPTSLNFRMDVQRIYGEKLYRNNTGYADIVRDTFFNKNFDMRRVYDLKYDLTKSIKIDFNANNYGIIDEPEGKIDNQEERDSIKSNIFGKNYFLGRNKQYTHAGNVSYQVPLNKFPLTDWISVNVKYGFNYNWQAGQFLQDSATGAFGIDPRTGNTIQNSNTKQVNGNFTLTTLYNKIPFLKRINSPKPARQPRVKNAPKPEPSKSASDTTGGKKPVVPKVKQPNAIPDGVRFVGKMLMGVKTIGFTYSETNGTVLPGYMNYSQAFGQDLDNNSPGLGFAFGSQKDVREKAVRDNWLTTDTSLNSSFARTYNQNFSGRSTIEPFDGMKIELNVTRQFTKNNSEYFRWNGSQFESQSVTETGNFSISTISLNTAFVKDDKDTYASSVFDEFSKNRKIISERLAADNPNSIGFAAADTFGVIYNDGYTGTQQEVLTMAFLSAYTGKSATSIKLNPFTKMPLPNWRITYDGLSKLPLFKQLFNTVSLTHSYRSTYSVNTFNRNLNYVESRYQIARDQSGNFIPAREFGQISISEQFAPLIGVDVTWKNNIQTRVEFKRDRNVSLTFAGVQVTEVKGNEITFGFGYRLPKFNLPFGLGGKKARTSGNSLNLTADFSARRNVTIIRRLLEGVNQPTAGLNVYSIKGAADYAVSERLNVRLFYEQTINTPVISTSYPTSNINTGVEIRFSLSQ